MNTNINRVSADVRSLILCLQRVRQGKLQTALQGEFVPMLPLDSFCEEDEYQRCRDDPLVFPGN